jgi:hypothetical protein
LCGTQILGEHRRIFFGKRTIMAHLIYLLLTVICLYALAQAWRAQQFSVQDGFILGGLYFFLIPSLLTLFAGAIDAEGLPIAPFTGERLDVAVYATLCILPLIAYAFNPAQNETPSHIEIGQFKFYFWMAIACVVTVFFVSGKSEGKHWADSSTTDGIIPNLLSVLLLTLRTYIFSLGLVVLKKHRGALYYLIAYAFIDIFLTGNRIAALYLAVAVMFSGAYTARQFVLPAFLLSIPTALFLSMYPAFRGVLWSEFGGFNDISGAAIYVYQNFDFSTLNGRFIWYFFEAANTSVFQHLFDTYGHTRDLIDGSTVLVKPLSLFIPREMWPDKPEGLGIRLGPDILGIEGLSLNSLLLGEFWANFGWMAPVAVTSLMLLVNFFSRSIAFLRREDIARYSFLLGFASWRHEFNYFIFSMIAGCVLILLMGPVSSRFNEHLEAP